MVLLYLGLFFFSIASLFIALHLLEVQNICLCISKMKHDLHKVLDSTGFVILVENETVSLVVLAAFL